MTRHQQLAADTLALVLAGGNGTRLGELTRWQCKPAVSFAGHFRNIDFTLSNCINSQMRRVGVLTQYKAQSLIGHITGGWNFLPRHFGEFIDVWPAQQRLHSSWYAGTADAVYQNLDLIAKHGAKYTLVLAGDHIYKMDYRELLERHADSGADVTIACLPVPIAQAGSFGVLEADPAGTVRRFREKPPISALNVANGMVLASMGIYVFATDYLIARLERDSQAPISSHDFGRDILPVAVREDHVAAFQFINSSGGPGYWRDVGTIEAYWQAHMDLLDEQPALDLYDPEWPIWTMPEQLPPAKVLDTLRHRSVVADSMLSAGTVIHGAAITRSVLAPKVRVGEDAELDESIVLPGAQIGAGCKLRRVIVESGLAIPDGTVVNAGGRGRDEITLLTQSSIARAVRSDWTLAKVAS